MASSLARPPALRIMCASPSARPAYLAGSSRASMQVRIAKLRAGGKANLPFSPKVALYFRFASRTSDSIWLIEISVCLLEKATLANDGERHLIVHRSKTAFPQDISRSGSHLTGHGVFVAVMLGGFAGILGSSCGEHVEPAQDDHDGKHPPQNPSLFEKCEHGICPPQSPSVTPAALDEDNIPYSLSK